MNIDKDKTDALTEAIRAELNSQDVYNFDAEAITDAVRVHMLSDEAVKRAHEALKVSGMFRFGKYPKGERRLKACLSAAMGDQS